MRAGLEFRSCQLAGCGALGSGGRPRWRPAARRRPSTAPTAAPTAAHCGERPCGERAGGEPVDGGQRRAPRARLHLVRGREQLRRADARGGAGRGGRRQRQAHGHRRQPRPRHPGPAAPGRGRLRQVRRDHPPAGLRRRRSSRTRRQAIAAGVAVGNIDQILGCRQHDGRPPGRGPVVERRLRAERARPQDRRARGHGVRRHEPVRGRLHLVGQGGRARRSTLRQAFDAAIAVNPNIKVVADSGESFYTTPGRPHGRPGHARRPTRRST